jgi:tetratricopeptide (TPR) repeat protein
MQFIVKKSNFLPAFFLLLVLLVVVVIYSPGLQGGFIFDDYPNLQELGTYGGVVDRETFNNFVFNGISSSLGRPLALATFLLDDNNWPSQGVWFKETNLKIHLLTGLFLCWASLNLMRLLGHSESEAAWVALLNCAIWLLHPYMISTTLYVVQRMAQLAALFMLCGVTGYLYGRLLIARNALRSGYIWMSLSLIVFTLVGLLSKENGILLPLLIIVIEACLPASTPKLLWQWRLIFLWLPASVIVIGMLNYIELAADAWPNRPFTQWERVLTQPRILWEYLYHLYIPRIEGRGLFQDGYSFSRNLLSPFTTLTSIVGLVCVIVVTIFYRKKFPIASIAILFFLVAHLLESTWLNLELYFEHRNYAASAFLFLPLAMGLVKLPQIINYKLAYCCGVLFFCVLAFLTWKRSNLWSDTERLQYYWAVSTPESVRAQNQIVQVLISQRKMDEAVYYLEAAAGRFPHSSFLTINLLNLKVYAGAAKEADFMRAGGLMVSQPFDAQAVSSLRALVDRLADGEVDMSYPQYTMALLDNVYANSSYQKIYTFKKLYFYCKARLYMKMSDYAASLANYKIAMKLYGDTDAALSMVAEVGNKNRPVEALILLAQAEELYKNQSDISLRRSRNVYDKEFPRMKFNLEALNEHNQQRESSLGVKSE